jgi:uncharacterized membrane protein YhaH (DUF805 family)
VHRGRIERVAFWLVTTATLTTFIGLTVPHQTGQRSEWYDRQLREDTAEDVARGRDPGPGPAVGLAIIEGGGCLFAVVLLAFGWLVLARDLSTASWPRWTPFDDLAGPLVYGVVALGCVGLGGFSWSLELVWAAVGEFAAAVGYALAVVGVD